MIGTKITREYKWGQIWIVERSLQLDPVSFVDNYALLILSGDREDCMKTNDSRRSSESIVPKKKSVLGRLSRSGDYMETRLNSWKRGDIKEHFKYFVFFSVRRSNEINRKARRWHWFVIHQFFLSLSWGRPQFLRKNKDLLREYSLQALSPPSAVPGMLPTLPCCWS